MKTKEEILEKIQYLKKENNKLSEKINNSQYRKHRRIATFCEVNCMIMALEWVLATETIYIKTFEEEIRGGRNGM